MKLFYVALAVITLSSCATTPKLSCDETCALEGMYCKGQTMGTATSSSISSNLTSFSGESSSRSFVCEKNDAKAAEIKSFREQAEAKQKAEYAEDAKEKACRGPQKSWPADCYE